MSAPRPFTDQFVQEVFAYTCRTYLETANQLFAEGKSVDGNLLVRIVDACTVIQQRMVDFINMEAGHDPDTLCEVMMLKASWLFGTIEALNNALIRPCTDCQHYTDISGKAHCTSVMNNMVDPVYGTEKQISPYCEDLRKPADGSCCGHYGRWFLKKEVVPEMVN